MMKIKKIIIVLLSFVVILSFAACGKEKSELNIEALGGFDSSEIEFYELEKEYIEDKGTLNLLAGPSDSLKSKRISAYGKVPVLDSSIKVNVEALVYFERCIYDLKNAGYEDIILRRGYEAKGDVEDHESGYDLDVYVEGKSWTDFDTESTKWLVENMNNYGFALRYPKADDYQPWHLRYVGSAHALALANSGMSIEEYISALELNTLYSVKGTSYVVYKTDRIMLPFGYRYDISSTADGNYIVEFDMSKSTALEKVESMAASARIDISELKIDSKMSLINPKHQFEHESDSLISICTKLSNDNDPKYLLASEALENLAQAFDYLNKLDNHIVYVSSAYRSLEEQEEIYTASAEGYAAMPGYSEHHTGFAVDIASDEKEVSLFNSTYLGYIFNHNAAKYGFIQRYRLETSSITGYKSEDWHYTFVGKPFAEYIYENNIAYEQFIEMLQNETPYTLSAENTELVIMKTKAADGRVKAFSLDDKVYCLYDDLMLIVHEGNN